MFSEPSAWDLGRSEPLALGSGLRAESPGQAAGQGRAGTLRPPPKVLDPHSDPAQGGNCGISGKSDADDFRRLLAAMEVLGFSAEDQDSIFRILASILHLGNVYFEKDEVRAPGHRTASSGHGLPLEAESCQLTAGSAWSTIWGGSSFSHWYIELFICVKEICRICRYIF